MFIYNFATHPWFDMTINISIGINMIFLCLEFHGAPNWYIEILEYANLAFVALFAFEAIFG